MASYTDLRALFSNDGIKNKLDIAIIIAANNLLTGTPTTAEQKWAASVFASPRGESSKAMMAMIADNNGLTIAQIQGAADAAIQTKVDAVVDTLVIAFTG